MGWHRYGEAVQWFSGAAKWFGCLADRLDMFAACGEPQNNASRDTPWFTLDFRHASPLEGTSSLYLLLLFVS
jgi:hypothetical protein